MSVYYKFKSSLEYDTLTFDGLHISVEELKKSILQNKKIGKSSDFDLQITHAQTKEVYTDNSVLIPKNTSLIVSRMPITGQKKNQNRNNDSPMHMDRGNLSPQADEKLSRTADLVNANASEDDKILAMMSQSSRDYDPSRYVRNTSNAGPLPPNYLCHRCGKPGHWIKHCPTNAMDVKRSTGIPKSFMVTVDGPDHKGAYLTSSGQYAVPSIDHEAYNNGGKKDAAAVTVKETEDAPEELLCLLCKNLLTDAVLIPCCGNSFCDECIRQLLLDSENHECPECHEVDVSPDNLIPTRSLRIAVKNFKNKMAMKARNIVVPPPQPATEQPPKIVAEKPVSPAPISTVVSELVDKPTDAAETGMSPYNLAPEQSPDRNGLHSPVASDQKPSQEDTELDVDDNRPGTPLADESPVNMANISPESAAIVPSLSHQMIDSNSCEPMPPGIDDVPPVEDGAQAIATLTTRGPVPIINTAPPPPQSHHRRHHTSSRPYHRSNRPHSDRYQRGKPYHHGKNRYSDSSSSYPPPTSSHPVPPPAYPGAPYGQPLPYPPPSHIPPAGYPPFDFHNRPPFPYDPYNYNYDLGARDPYDEFKRKMREKDARSRRYTKRSRSRSRSKSASSFSSLSRSRSRSLSPRFGRPRSRSPSRYRKKSPVAVPPRRDASRNHKRHKRSSFSPPSTYPDRLGYKPRSHESSYHDSRYRSPKPHTQVSRVEVHHDRAYDSRSSKDRRSHEDRNGGVKDKPRRPKSDEERVSSPKVSDKRHRGDRSKHDRSTPKLDEKKRRSASPSNRKSPDHGAKSKKTEEKLEKSDGEKPKKRKEENSKASDADKVKDSVAESGSEADKAKQKKKRKHKKHKDKSKSGSDTTKKKKKVKTENSVMETSSAPTTDIGSDVNDLKVMKDEKQEDTEVEKIVQEKTGTEPVEEKENGDSVAKQPEANPEPEEQKIEELPPEQRPVASEFLPELSKWEREDDDEQQDPVADNDISESKADKQSKNSLSSEIIQRAEKVILLKAPKPSTLSSSLTVSTSEKKPDRIILTAKKPEKLSTRTSHNDKNSRFIADSENLKITISNDDKKSDLSRKRLDRSKFSDKNSSSDNNEPDHEPRSSKYTKTRPRTRSRSPAHKSKERYETRQTGTKREKRNHSPIRFPKRSKQDSESERQKDIKLRSEVKREAIIHDDESNFVPDYDSTSDSQSDESEALKKVVKEKEPKKHKKAKKEKKHKKHKRKKSKSKYKE